LAKEARQNSHALPGLEKQLQTAFCHFHLIILFRESASTAFDVNNNIEYVPQAQ
jgi:hypothetical protein